MGWEGSREKEKDSPFYSEHFTSCVLGGQHLSDELQKVVRERQSALDRALGQLQYQRELSRLQLLHIQVLTSGLGQGDVCVQLLLEAPQQREAPEKPHGAKHRTRF